MKKHHQAFDQIKSLIDTAQHVVVIQADNPDGDSLGSALALEEILGALSKTVDMYCGVDVPYYTHYLPGWSRVSKDLPKDFDLSIIVDTSTTTLLDKLLQQPQAHVLHERPCIVLDHHQTANKDIPFATTTINAADVSSTGELIYHLAHYCDWPINETAGESIMTAVLGDTQGLSNSLTLPSTYRALADLVEQGVNRPALEARRREFNSMPESVFYYKAKLIERTRLYDDGRVAVVVIPQSEIIEFSPLYNQPQLIQFDILQIDTVELVVIIKQYDTGIHTGAVRANYGSTYAGALAKQFGGGGHDYVSGFKTDQYANHTDQLISDIVSASIPLRENNKTT